jgi:hypothetical protein
MEHRSIALAGATAVAAWLLAMSSTPAQARGCQQFGAIIAQAAV